MRRSIIAVALGVFIVGGGWLAWRISLRPTISRDYLAELNDEIDRIPDADSARPIYERIRQSLDAHAATRPQDPDSYIDWVEVCHAYPGDPAWDTAAALFEQDAAMLLAVVRAAASKPRAGLFIETTSASPTTPAFGGLGTVALRYLGAMRACARLLNFDARLAIAEGDGPRFVEDIRDTLAVARHCNEPPFLIGYLTSLAIVALANDTTMWALTHGAGALSDTDLAALEQEWAGVEAMLDFRPVLAIERMVMDDWVQRIYSDDGRGSGRMTIMGARLLRGLNVNEPARPRLVWTPSRRSVNAGLDRFYQTAEIMATTHPATWDTDDVAWVRAARDSDAALGPLGTILPHPEGLSRSHRRVNTELAGVRTAVAVERFRRAKGRMPERLADLVPEFLPAAPVDGAGPTPASTLGWANTDLGWTLYSVGHDGRDDGGTPMVSSGRPQGFPQPLYAGPADHILFPHLHDPVELPARLAPTDASPMDTATEAGPPADPGSE